MTRSNNQTSGAQLVGKWIYLNWTKELKAWCAAKVLTFKPLQQKHQVQYEDGERECVDLLAKERDWTEKEPKKVRNCKGRRAKELAKELGIKVEMNEALVDVADELLDMEDRLPNQGVKSQLPKFWHNLRVQILKCKNPKDILAATTRFAEQIKDCVVLEDWKSQHAAKWQADAKRAATEADVAELVHQIKFKMVDWAQCRALFPSMEEEAKPKPAKVQPAKVQPAKAQPVSAKVTDRGTAKGAGSSEDGVAVECNGQQGKYQPQSHMIVCLCGDCGGMQAGLSPSAWQEHVGCRTRNWKRSIKLANINGKLSSWLQAQRQSDPSFAFYQLSPEEKGPKSEPQVLPKSKVSQLPPQSASRLREQNHPEMGQLLPKQKTKLEVKGGKGAEKREREDECSRGNSDGEDSFEQRPAKRASRSSFETRLASGAVTAPKRKAVQPWDATSERLNEEDQGELACVLCDLSTHSHEILRCDGDECGQTYHTYCLIPQLEKIPEGDWFCPSCQPKMRTDNNATSPKQENGMGLGRPQVEQESPDNGFSFFQTLFNEGPSNNPLFANSEPQDSMGAEKPEKLEEVMASQPPKSTFMLPDDIDDDDELLAFAVPGSAYAARVGC